MYCMAANSREVLVSAKRALTRQIWRSNSASLLLNFRTAHTSSYDKNDEDLSQNVVIDEVNQPHSEKYWAPHPKTGVFGPVSEQTSEGASSSSLADGGKDSVMEEKAWFRPTSVEDLEKPPL